MKSAASAVIAVDADIPANVGAIGAAHITAADAAQINDLIVFFMFVYLHFLSIIVKMFSE